MAEDCDEKLTLEANRLIDKGQKKCPNGNASRHFNPWDACILQGCRSQDKLQGRRLGSRATKALARRI